MADNLQRAINKAAKYFFGPKAQDRLTDEEEILLNHTLDKPLRVLGTGYLVAKGYLKYKGDDYYYPTAEGYIFYSNLVKNGDIKQNKNKGFNPDLPVETRDGRKARIICKDASGKKPIIALITVMHDEELAVDLYADGKQSLNGLTDDDLVNTDCDD